MTLLREEKPPRRAKPTEEQLIWAAYTTAPKTRRLYKTIDGLTPEARRIWLDIARRRIAGGWDYPWHRPDDHGA